MTVCRNRMLFAFSHPIQRGDLDDYVQWSLQLPQITRAWAVGPQHYGPGTVTVYFMEDADHAPEFGIPQGTNGASRYEPPLFHATGDQLVLADYLFPKRSATPLVFIEAPVGVALDVEVSGHPR